jgi:hypothetical protein
MIKNEIILYKIMEFMQMDCWSKTRFEERIEREMKNIK